MYEQEFTYAEKYLFINQRIFVRIFVIFYVQKFRSICIVNIVSCNFI